MFMIQIIIFVFLVIRIVRHVITQENLIAYLVIHQIKKQMWFINKEIGINIISSYKRASNILTHELNDKEFEISNTVDPILFKDEQEKNLYKKTLELRKYFVSINKDENYDLSLKKLAESKKVIFEFFDNVIVNDEDKTIKKNRLEILSMLCKTFDSYIIFSNIESL